MAFDPAPTGLDRVVDPIWLTAMLQQRWPRTVVESVEIVETLVTMATKVRLALTFAANTGAPTRICIKGVLTDSGAHPSSSIGETRFYRDMAAHLDVRVPLCVYASLDATDGGGVVVMHDVIAAGGRFCSALDAFTPDQAMNGLDQLARLHVAAPSAPDSAWVPRFLDQITQRPILPAATLQELLDGPRGDPLPPTVRDAARLQRGLEALAVDVRAAPSVLVHGDAHAGNVYRDAEGQLGLVDWQVLQQGDWAQDVAYHLAAVLTPEDRRTHERALLDDYLDRRHALRGPRIDRDIAWRRYRAAMVYGYYLWAITRKVDPPLIAEFVRRLGLATADLESFDLLGV
jgi:hypothetical protein